MEGERKMQATRQFMQKLEQMMRQSERDGYISYPVLRTIENKTGLAVFIIDYEERRDGRPEMYIMADIDTGEKRKAFSCEKQEFSDAPYDISYDPSVPSGVENSEEFRDSLFGQMDSIRQMIVEGVDPFVYQGRYEKYMEKMLAVVPVSYQKFYRDLSRLPEETEIKKETYPVQDVLWKPVRNLSTVPEAVFRAAERIAEQIRFLPAEQPGIIRYEYPSFCLKEDRKESGDPWQELLVRMGNGSLVRGHYKTVPKKSIYTTCSRGQNGACIFGRCPYLVAAYIRFLKDWHPEELKKQRLFYLGNRFAVDAEALPGIKTAVKIPEGLDRGKLREALATVDRGNFSVYEEEGLTVSWIREENQGNLHLEKRTIPYKTLDKKRAGEVRDVEGKAVEEEILYDLYAYLLDASGQWENYMSEEENMQGWEEECCDQTLAIQDREQEVKETSVRKIPKKEKTGQKTAVREKKDTVEQMDRGRENPGLAYQCASDPECMSFYGVYEYADKEDRSVADRIYSLLRKKGTVRGKTVIDLKDLKHPLLTDKFYIVRNLAAEEIPPELKKFTPGASVLLCGSNTEIECLFKSGIFRNIYGKCRITGNIQEAEKVYRKLQELLPKEMREQLAESTVQELADWMEKTNLPVNNESLADFIAWQCVLMKQLVFLPCGKEGRKDAEE